MLIILGGGRGEVEMTGCMRHVITPASPFSTELTVTVGSRYTDGSMVCDPVTQNLLCLCHPVTLLALPPCMQVSGFPRAMVMGGSIFLPPSVVDPNLG
jgi:hypothetical protein